DYSAGSEYVIVNESASSCLPIAKQQPVYESLEAANEQLGNTEGWGELDARQRQAEAEAEAEGGTSGGETAAAHQQRLASLPECAATNRRPPCKVGQIIVEAEGEQELEVWRRD